VLGETVFFKVVRHVCHVAAVRTGKVFLARMYQQVNLSTQPHMIRVSEWGLTAPSTHYRSFWRRVFPVNHLHWYWQPNKNNKETEHVTQCKKVALVNSTVFTHSKKN